MSDPRQRAQAAALLTATLHLAAHPQPDPTLLSSGPVDPQHATRALAELFQAGVALTDFALGQPSLDDVFLTLTGHPAAAPTDAEPAA